MASSNTFVALLRGINVGGNNIVSMAKLKTTFEELGFKNVRTFINSGNIIFETSKKAPAKIISDIERAIKKDFGFDIRVIIRSLREMEVVCNALPDKWVTDKITRTDIMFLWEEVDSPKALDEIPSNPKVDRLKYVSGAVIWNVNRDEIGQSKVPKYIGSHIYKHMTARNANTTRRLLELMKKGD